jgi:hypothetical protein
LITSIISNTIFIQPYPINDGLNSLDGSIRISIALAFPQFDWVLD